jgi:hypothetical protein
VRFKEILDDTYARLKYTSAPPAAIQKRIKGFANETHREILALSGLSRLRDAVVPVTVSANVARSGLPPMVARVNLIVDRANNERLTQVSFRDLRMADPAQTFVGGPPRRYAVVGYQQVQQQPASATGLWAASSSASDANSPTVFCETMTTGGFRHVTAQQGTVLTGTTRVQLGTRTDSIDITKFALSQVCVGYISLYDAAAGGNELARIEPGQTYARYLAVEWEPTPTVDAVLYADVTRAIVDLVNETDEPLLPPDFHDLIGIGTRLKEYEEIDDSRAVQAQVLYQRRQNALKSFVLNDGDRLVSLRRLPAGWSQLGANFPAGS